MKRLIKSWFISLKQLMSLVNLIAYSCHHSWIHTYTHRNHLSLPKRYNEFDTFRAKGLSAFFGFLFISFWYSERSYGLCAFHSTIPRQAKLVILCCNVTTKTQTATHIHIDYVWEVYMLCDLPVSRWMSKKTHLPVKEYK